MPIVQLIFTIIVVGVVLGLINNYIPMDSTIKKILNVVIVIILILWLLGAVGITGSMHPMHMWK